MCEIGTMLAGADLFLGINALSKRPCPIAKGLVLSEKLVFCGVKFGVSQDAPLMEIVQFHERGVQIFLRS